jgi:uncharacterized membrane protein
MDAQPARLFPVDVVRGGLMALMALDHARDFIAQADLPSELWNRPAPPAVDALLFLTRFVTHLCAPGFFLLMGAGLALFAENRARAGWPATRIAGHFLLRGILLIALQFLVEDPAWGLRADFGDLSRYAGVLYALGTSMIVGGLLVRAPAGAVAAVGAGAVLLTGLVIPALPPPPAAIPIPARLLLVAGATDGVLVLYPALPWLAPTALGLLLGRALARNPAAAYRWAGWMGLGCLVGFALLRALGGFGNLRPVEGPGLIAFFSLVKYPPALTYLLWTLGIDLLALYGCARLAGAGRRAVAPLAVFGGSALFFYLVHLYGYGLAGRLFAPQGTGLVAMYPVWVLGLAVLFVLCRWYGRFKRRQPPDSFWRLL